MNASKTKNSVKTENSVQTDLVCIARIKGAFGVKGEVRIIPFTESSDDVFSYGPLLGEDGKIVLSPTGHRPVKDGFAVKCPEVSTPEQADALRGTELFTAKGNLPDPDEDEFYYSDLIGMQVKTVDGKTAGTIIAVHDFGAGDLIEIKPKEGGSFYHPFTKDAVPKVDMKARRIIVKIVEAVNGKDPNEGKEIVVSKVIDRELPIPEAWRQALKKLADAVVARKQVANYGEFLIKNIDDEVLVINSGNIDDYPDAIGPLEDQTWDSSVSVWTGSKWELLIDLITFDGQTSDLVLHASIEEIDEGYLIKPGLIYVP